MGTGVVEIANGDDALDWLGPGVVDGDLERIPDLVVSNVQLPYFNGLEILEQLQVCTRRIPVILITSDPETFAQAWSLGARCVLARPFDVGELRVAVQTALQTSRDDTPGAQRCELDCLDRGRRGPEARDRASAACAAAAAR